MRRCERCGSPHFVAWTSWGKYLCDHCYPQTRVAGSTCGCPLCTTVVVMPPDPHAPTTVTLGGRLDAFAYALAARRTAAVLEAPPPALDPTALDPTALREILEAPPASAREPRNRAERRVEARRNRRRA